MGMASDDDVVMRSLFVPHSLDERISGLAFKLRMGKADLTLLLLQRGLDAMAEDSPPPATAGGVTPVPDPAGSSLGFLSD